MRFERSDLSVVSNNCDHLYLHYFNVVKAAIGNYLNDSPEFAPVISMDDAEDLTDIRVELDRVVLTPQFDMILGGDDEHFAQYTLIQLAK